MNWRYLIVPVLFIFCSNKDFGEVHILGISLRTLGYD